MASDQLLFCSMVERAMRVAARAHRTQHRKASDLPYISHPASVVMLLLRAGIDSEEILAAALLHDVVEDTDVSLDELHEQFPPQVVQLVMAMTERKQNDAGQNRSWQDRKEEHLVQIASANWEARAIALADKLHNLGAMLVDHHSGEEVWTRFNAPREKVLWYHREMIAAAEQGDTRLTILASECRQLVEQLEAI